MTDVSALRAVVSYDAEMGEVRLIRNNRVLGSITKAGYFETRLLGRRWYLHRLAWTLVHGAEPDGVIDHINGDGTDNRLCNLRLASQRENTRNVSRHSDNKTGFKGVVFRKGRKRPYHAMIYLHGAQKCLGYFTTPEAAHSAYFAAAQHFYGEFARPE